MSTLSGFKGSFYCTEHRAPTEQEIFDEGVAEGKRRYAVRPYPAALLLPAYAPFNPLRLQVWTDGQDLPVDAFYGMPKHDDAPYFYAEDGTPIENVVLWKYVE